jgi:hypothetical protein
VRYLPEILALLIAIAGWFYLFYSRAAHKLQGVEDPVTNNRRIRLRRINGFVILLLGITMYAGFRTVSTNPPTMAFLVVWLAVFVLMMIMVTLGMIDVRLTRKLRDRRKGGL